MMFRVVKKYQRGARGCKSKTKAADDGESWPLSGTKCRVGAEGVTLVSGGQILVLSQRKHMHVPPSHLTPWPPPLTQGSLLPNWLVLSYSWCLCSVCCPGPYTSFVFLFCMRRERDVHVVSPLLRYFCALVFASPEVLFSFSKSCFYIGL